MRITNPGFYKCADDPDLEGITTMVCIEPNGFTSVCRNGKHTFISYYSTVERDVYHFDYTPVSREEYMEFFNEAVALTSPK